MFFMSKLNLHHNATDKLKQQGGRKRREAGRKKGRKRREREMEYRTGKGRKRGSGGSRKRRRNGKRGINKMSSCDWLPHQVNICVQFFDLYLQNIHISITCTVYCSS